MNKLIGVVSKITSSGELTLVEIQMDTDTLSAIIVEDLADPVEIGEKVAAIFKETEVALAVEFAGRISLRNRLNCKVTAIERGKILTSVHLMYQGTILTSIITTSSAELLGLQPDLSITAFIKTNELMLMKV